MKIKKLFATIMTCVSLLGFAGIASAGVAGDINIWGSSALFNFWAAESGPFLTSQGCTGVKTATLDAKDGIATGLCNGVNRYFRYSNKASYDGVLAIEGNSTSPNLTEPPACPDPTQRPMVNPATCNFSTGTCSGSACYTITGGASDVQVTSFQQESHGELLGPNNGGEVNYTFRGANGVTLTPAVTDACQPIAVPFAFYVNKTVTQNSATITNLTTANVRLLFSGQVGDWSDLLAANGQPFDAKPVNVCLRHAGSGTHATLDFAVMRPAGLIIQESINPGSYNFYFNSGSSDELKCVNQLPGAVGYSDADAILNFSSYPNTTQVTYNGVTANKNNVVNGAYDFWTIENIYTANPVPADMQNVCTFIANPANLTFDPYYATSTQLIYSKSADAAYPTAQ